MPRRRRESDRGVDTISAIATAPGRGGIGIVRVSGPGSARIAGGILGRRSESEREQGAGEVREEVKEEKKDGRKDAPPPRQALFRDFLDAQGRVIDSGIALFFPGPGSFTGEDVLELQGHGGREVLRLLHQRTLELGARHARPGEFSERAFLNGRIDLLQAEAIADLIDAASTQAARAAARTLQGAFSRRVHDLVEALTRLRVEVEAAIDFPEEDIDVLGSAETAAALASIKERLADTRREATQGALLKEGIRVVIAGKPNAGKSSLLNTLAGQDAAIVTPVPGTTRDLLSANIHIDGLPLQVVDTAGLRPSMDPVEQEGVRRARAAIDTADRVLLLIDSSVVPPEQISGKTVGGLLKELKLTVDRLSVVLSKSDLLPEPGKKSDGGKAAAAEIMLAGKQIPLLHLSAKTGEGMAALREHLTALAGYQSGEETTFAARSRHLEALDEAAELLAPLCAAAEAGQKDRARDKTAPPQSPSLELVAEDLRLTQQALGRITGEVTADDLLGEIFSSFCIGK